MQGELPAVVSSSRRPAIRSLAVVCLTLLAARSPAQPPGYVAASGQAYRDHSRVAHDGALLAVVQPRHHAVVLFDSRPTPPRPVFAFGRYGRQAGEFLHPTGIALDARRGLVYVSDTGNDRIEVFRLDTDAGGQVRGAAFAKAIGQHGAEPGMFDRPAGLALDGDGRLYVCDSGNRRVQVFDAQLVFAEQWGGGAADRDLFVTPASLSIARDGTVFVSDIGRLQVQVLDRAGTPLYAWGAPQHPEKGLADDEHGFPFAVVAAGAGAYVSDTRRQQIRTFRGPKFLTAWGGPGNEDGRFFQPEGIAAIGDRVLVIDQGGHRGQIFSTAGTFVASFAIPAGDLFPWATPPAQ